MKQKTKDTIYSALFIMFMLFCVYIIAIHPLFIPERQGFDDVFTISQDAVEQFNADSVLEDYTEFCINEGYEAVEQGSIKLLEVNNTIQFICTRSTW